jgi:DNA-binding transcriptional MocR family regulator
MMRSMKKKWDPGVLSGGGPKYLALVESLEARIASGELSPGDRLPSHRELGNIFGVTIATVTKAMGEATRRGIVEARLGSGTFIRDRETANGEPNAIDLCINTLPTAIVADILAEAITQVSSERLCHDLFNYMSYAGSAQHRKLGAAWISQFGTKVRPQNLLLTNGVHQGLLAAFGALLATGQTAICEPLTYTGIKRIADFRGIQLVGAESDEQGLVPDSVDRELRRTGAKVLIVTTVMQNPTTATMTAERRLALIEICRRNDTWIIEDGVNIPLANDGIPSLADAAPERTIHLTGFSKCIASGFRLGYAAIPEPLLGAFHEALVSTQWIGPGFYAELAASMFANGMIEKCIARHREEAAARTALARQILASVKKTKLPSYHAWVNTPAGWSAEDFATHALRAGVRISPASHFAISLADLPAAYRISLGACTTRAELENALTKLANIGNGRLVSYDTVI